MALMRTRSQLNVSSLIPPPPPPSPIPRARGSRSAASEVLTEIIERSVQVPELTLPESHSGGEFCGSRHLIPAEIDFRLLASRREGSVDRLVRSAREFGAFRVSHHGISTEELRSLVRESGRVFGVLEGRDTGFRRSVVGNRDEIVWVRSWKERMEWAREYIGPERYRCFSQEMENVADKLDGIARKLGQIMIMNSRRQSDKRIQRGESVLNVYRYNHENVTEQSPPLPKEKTEEMLHYTLSLHLPAKNCEFRVNSAKGPLSFHADPDTILVTFGRQLEEWSLGEFKCRQGEIIYHPDAYGSRTSFSVELNGDDNQSALFGKYELGNLLGSGAFAKVYQARDLHNGGESVAIKVVHKKRLKDGLTAHVKREISVMRRLRHPHIVLLSEVLATKTKIFFVMELAKGGELFSRVTSNRFTESLSQKYVRQLISAVRYCHARGVFHRDLKPENLLLDENRDLKVSDFGLSAMKEQIQPDGMLHTLCGTPAYVAPELLLKNGYDDDGSKADIWACGVVLFLLNAGYLPFRDPNIKGLYRKIKNAQYKMPVWASADLRMLLRRLLEPDPVRRITVEEILHDPWFNHGVNPSEIIGIQADDYDMEESGKNLNAFDIIASGTRSNLAGLFRSFVTPDHCDQFVSDETTAEIIRKVEEVAKQLNLRIAKRKERAIKLEGPHGFANVVVKIRLLSDELVMVEMKNNQRDVGLVWADALRRKLRRLINQPVYRIPNYP